MRQIILCTLFFAMLESCTNKQIDQNLTPEQLIATFSSRKSQLDFIVNNLEKDRKLNLIFQIGPDRGLPPIEKSYSEVYAVLKRTGITDASSHPNVCPKKTTWYYFKTNWQNEYPIYLIYNAYQTYKPCEMGGVYNEPELLKGEHKIDEVSNEWWGLGDHWTLFRLVKEKSVKF